MKIFGWFFLLAVIFGPLPASGSASSPSWDETPAALREAAGVVRQGDWLFATGAARATSSESAKANELARKRSLFEALKLMRFAASCDELVVSLPEKDREPFLLLYADLAPDISLKGTTTIRQWEKGDVHFTAVAVPLASLPETVCAYAGQEALFSAYIKSGAASATGLDFALSRVSRHTALSREIRKALALLYAGSEAGADNPITLCLSETSPPVTARTTPLDELRYLNRLDTARQYIRLAERLLATDPEESSAYIMMALDRAPFYSRPHLLLSDLFRHRFNKPAYALAAAEKGLRDGNSHHEAVARMVASLNALHSPEAEVFQYLLGRSKPLPENFDEKALLEYSTGSWGGDVDRFEEHSLPWLVLFSLGQAIEGTPQQPPPEFRQASELFGRAAGEKDFQQILDLLLTAIDKAPSCPETYNLMGSCYRYLGKPELALPFLWQALKLRPDYDFALTNLGLVCQQLGLMKSAGFYFGHQAVKDSDNAWVRSNYRKFAGVDQ